MLELVRSLAADTSFWQPHVRFTSDSRYWHRLGTIGALGRQPGVDLWLLTWMPDQFTDLHDHGDAAATFTVVSGSLTEVRVRPGGALSTEELTAGSVRTVPAGAVHDVRNTGTEPAISIHAYSPRLSEMNFWERVPGGIRRLSTVLTDQPEVA